jgi:signal transduction histidine kinase
MASATSTSARKLPVVNDRCALRRNVKVQPYGRCSVCSLQLGQCHAWQSSWLSFGLVILAVMPLLLPSGWPLQASVVVTIGVLVAQGMLVHRRTDELIYGQHRLLQTSRELEESNRGLEAAKRDLERQVAERTAKLRDANRSLAVANLELAESARRKEAAMLEVSHDLRTPLTSIKGAAQNLLDGIAGRLVPDQREYLEIVRDHADRLIGAVSALLESARAEAVTSPVTFVTETADVGALAADVVRSLQPIAKERAVELGAETRGVAASVDTGKLRQVIENLVGNALKFTDAGGRVSVHVDGDDDAVTLSVRDTGVGIDEPEMKHLFDRFRRAPGGRPGTGLGLAITRDLVRLHGGDISVSSRPGEGTIFEVLLPRSAA